MDSLKVETDQDEETVMARESESHVAKKERGISCSFYEDLASKLDISSSSTTSWSAASCHIVAR
jgi:hypothetical protein